MEKLASIDFARYQNHSLISEQVCNSIKDAILSGILHPGDSFTDSAVAEQFSISRTPAREGLLCLVREGFLESVSRKGFVVCSIRLEEARELYNVSIALEPCAAAEAARNRTQLNIDQLTAVLPSESDSIEDAEINNFKFHVLIAQASGNRLLCEYIRQIREKMQIMHTFHGAHDYNGQGTNFLLTAVNENHIQIFNAIVARDYEMAEFMMRRHLTQAKNYFFASPAI